MAAASASRAPAASSPYPSQYTPGLPGEVAGAADGALTTGVPVPPPAAAVAGGRRPRLHRVRRPTGDLERHGTADRDGDVGRLPLVGGGAVDLGVLLGLLGARRPAGGEHESGAEHGACEGEESKTTDRHGQARAATSEGEHHQADGAPWRGLGSPRSGRPGGAVPTAEL